MYSNELTIVTKIFTLPKNPFGNLRKLNPTKNSKHKFSVRRLETFINS